MGAARARLCTRRLAPRSTMRQPPTRLHQAPSGLARWQPGHTCTPERTRRQWRPCSAPCLQSKVAVRPHLHPSRVRLLGAQPLLRRLPTEEGPPAPSQPAPPPLPTCTHRVLTSSVLSAAYAASPPKKSARRARSRRRPRSDTPMRVTARGSSSASWLEQSVTVRWL